MKLGFKALEPLKNGGKFRGSAKNRPVGNAVILDFDYLGIVYEILDFAGGSARLRGPKPPPQRAFDVLMYVNDQFVEGTARWDGFHVSIDPKQKPEGLSASADRLGLSSIAGVEPFDC